MPIYFANLVFKKKTQNKRPLSSIHKRWWDTNVVVAKQPIHKEILITTTYTAAIYFNNGFRFYNNSEKKKNSPIVCNKSETEKV